jgi:2-polyprenyl-6-methoxyphenol hydroxylase-like FAD-dependent oxidoreductase
MSKIIVLGGGIVGLSTAMLLARQGHNVTAYERDSTPLPNSPDAAWEAWERRGVAQFRQPHYLHSAARLLLDAHLPEVKQALLEAGCVPFDKLSLMPPSILDRSARVDDARFVTVTGRRPTLEYAVARAAEQRVEVVRGTSIAGVLTGRSVADGIPHVTGVRLMNGSVAFADLVIDATGRHSKLPSWLRAVDAASPVEEAEESAFVYHTRFFRAASGGVPPYRSGIITHFHTFSLLLLPGDSNTWSVTVFTTAADAPLRALRDPARWEALVSACPAHAHWLDGEPISDILTFGGFTDRYRSFVMDGSPVATGIVAVGDAWACTNPVQGRGMTIGLMHAIGTAEVVNEHLDDPLALAQAHHAMTESRVTPWYRSTVEFDRWRTSQITAAINGQSAPRSGGPAEALETAMLYDPALFRASMEIVGLLALPEAVFARPGIVKRIMALADIHEPPTPAGPSRDELLRMVA